MFTTKRHLLKLIDQERVRRAIEQAEARTSGEVRVSVAPVFWGHVESAAQKAFSRMGMDRTKDRNGVLFFVVPARRRFVVLGDAGIHAKVGQEFWDDVASTVSDHFRKSQFTDGLVAGIERVGERLAEHFPFDVRRDVNELPNEIDYGRSSI